MMTTRAFRRAVIRVIFLVLVPAIALAAGVHYYLENARYVTTENAYVKATVVAISAEVSGRVAEVLVGQNRPVQAGALLFRIDSEPFRIALLRAEAELARVRNEIEALRADYRQARIEIAEAREDIAYYGRVFSRQKSLAGRGHASKARYDEAERNLANARQRASALRQKSLQILARLGGRLDLAVDAHPDYIRALASRNDAELDLRRTRVHAPASGIIGPVRIEPGEFVEAGSPVMPLIATDSPWVEANLKETQLTHVQVGQQARIAVDAYPGHELRATVQSISPSTGAELSILPPQNASGNWVKVVQRVPVRLSLAGGQPMPPLRTGMTVSVSIDTEREVSLGDLIGSALAWRADGK